MTSPSTWKKAESRAAANLGAKRTPLSGGNSGHTRSDSLHKKIFLEHKYRAKQAIWTLFREVREKAKDEGKVPMLALSEKSAHGQLLVIHSKDLAKLLEILRAQDREHNVSGACGPVEEL